MNDTDLEIMTRQERGAEYARLTGYLVEVLRFPRLELPSEVHRVLDRLSRIDQLDTEELREGDSR